MTIAELRQELENIAQTYSTNSTYVNVVRRLNEALLTIQDIVDDEGAMYVIDDLAERLVNRRINLEVFYASILAIWHFASGEINYNRLLALQPQAINFQDLRVFLQRVDDSTVNIAQEYIQRQGANAYNDFINSVGEASYHSAIIAHLVVLLERTDRAFDRIDDNDLDANAFIATESNVNIVTDDEEGSSQVYQVYSLASIEYDHNIEDIFSSMYQNAKPSPVVSSFSNIEQITLIPSDVIEHLTIIIGAVYAYFTETAELAS